MAVWWQTNETTKKKEYLANNYFVAFYKKSKETKIEIIEIFPKYTEIK